MMKRGITLGELVATSITILIVIISSYINVKVTIENHANRLDALERDKIKAEERNQKQFEMIDGKIDKLTDAFYEMKYELQTKQDKK